MKASQISASGRCIEVTTPLLETFLFDFAGDLYGKHLAVDFVAYIRPEAKLDGLEALKAQIARDSEARAKGAGCSALTSPFVLSGGPVTPGGGNSAHRIADATYPLRRVRDV